MDLLRIFFRNIRPMRSGFKEIFFLGLSKLKNAAFKDFLNYESVFLNNFLRTVRGIKWRFLRAFFSRTTKARKCVFYRDIYLQGLSELGKWIY